MTLAFDAIPPTFASGNEVAAFGQRAVAFAPAGVGNLAVGFDVLGAALDCLNADNQPLGDTVTARWCERGGVMITALRGLPLPLPEAAERNTAGKAVLALLEALGARGISGGFELEIEKGIPLGSGLGGSAASAVAAVVAANAACGSLFSATELYQFALQGEAVASGALHGDNVGPQLLGGVCYTTIREVRQLPISNALWVAVVHPDFVLETKRARAALAVPFSMAEFVAQSERLAGFLIGLYEGDAALLRRSLQDVLVEPKRAELIPGFAAVKQAALDGDSEQQCALGSSISGAGPSVFAWFLSESAAQLGVERMCQAFALAGLPAQCFVAPVAGRGARVLQIVGA